MGRKGRYYIIRETDVKLRTHPGGEGTHWFTTNGPPDACEQDADLYDLEGVMTHERGHSLGLTHVLPLDDHPTLTMSRRPDNCDRDYRDLAKGDIRGLQRIYGT